MNLRAVKLSAGHHYPVASVGHVEDLVSALLKALGELIGINIGQGLVVEKVDERVVRLPREAMVEGKILPEDGQNIRSHLLLEGASGLWTRTGQARRFNVGNTVGSAVVVPNAQNYDRQEYELPAPHVCI